jgi:hypothetical protein
MDEVQKGSAKGAAIGISIGLLAVGAFALMFFLFFGSECENDKLIQTGTAAKATILAIEDTGNRYNDQPQVKIRLKLIFDTWGGLWGTSSE